MRKCNFALRLQPSLLTEARKVAEAEGVALNQLINVAVAEKLSALRTEDAGSRRCGRARSVQPRRCEREYRVAPPRHVDQAARGRTSRAIASPLSIRAFVRSCMACRFIQNSGLVP